MYINQILVIFAYLLGSINSAIIICKIMGLPSPRSVGSGNPGATNVLRLGSKKAAAATLIGDVLKGVIPVSIGHVLHMEYHILAWIALAAIIGHIYPIFFKFQGGKGVATALGAICAINPILGLAVLATWGIMAVLFRMSSLASLTAIVLAPFYAYWIIDNTVIIPLTVIAILIVIRHKGNIARILHHQEPKLGQKK